MYITIPSLIRIYVPGKELSKAMWQSSKEKELRIQIQAIEYEFEKEFDRERRKEGMEKRGGGGREMEKQSRFI